MALNWKQVKGFWQSDNTASNMRYTFINFKDTFDISTMTENLLPDIYINTVNENENIVNGEDQSTGKNYGHIVTTRAENTFHKDQYLATLKSLGWKVGSTTVANIGRDAQHLYINDNSIIRINTNGTERIKLTTSDINFSNAQVTFNTTTGSGATPQNADFRVAGYSNFAKAVHIDAALTVSTACNAQYFNATSDIRAKEEIIPLEFNALDFIKNLNLYSFNYKSNHQPSIGVIAQELQDINIQGFSLIDNKEASGEEDDYMSVKESKLIYILCKAVKELEAEVESLKAQLKNGK